MFYLVLFSKLLITNGCGTVFVDHIVAKFPFRIQQIRTDRGHEFQAQFHWHVEDLGIGHTYIKARTPQLNGKVERSHRSDQEEFYQLLSYPVNSSGGDVVNGSNQPICDSSIDLRPICGPKVCPIEPPSIKPINPPTIAPIGTKECIQEQVWDYNLGK